MRQKLDSSLNLLGEMKSAQASLTQDKDVQAQELLSVREELLAAKQNEQKLIRQLQQSEAEYEKRL
jgi:hypothetical protein